MRDIYLISKEFLQRRYYFNRGEIEELYERVTLRDFQKQINASNNYNGLRSRTDNMRALMLVLPYNTDNTTEENLQVKGVINRL